MEKNSYYKAEFLLFITEQLKKLWIFMRDVASI